MKRIQYKLLGYGEEYNEKTGKTEILEHIATVSAEDTEAQRKTAEATALDGSFLCFEDAAQVPAPSRLDMLEAQAVYTAMMTDTLTEV